MSWKKVITSGSNASLNTITGSRLFLPSIAGINSGGLSTDYVLIKGISGIISKAVQSTITGDDTTYDAQAPEIILVANEFSIVSGSLNHNDLGNYTGSQHIKWDSDQSGQPYVIHTDNYTNTTYTGVSGIAITDPIADNSEVSTSPTQSWTGVGALATASSIGSLNDPADFQINNTGSIQSTFLYSTEATASTISVSTNASVGYVSASTINVLPNGTVNVGTTTDPGYLGIQGTFYFNGLEFVDNIISTHTGSHLWGGPELDTTTTWNGNIYVIPPGGVTASGTYYGDGSQLTGIDPAGVEFETLSTGSGISGSSNYDFSSETTFSIQLDNTTDGTNSGLLLETSGLSISSSGVTSAFISSSAVTSAKIKNLEIKSESLANTLISAFPLSSGVTPTDLFLLQSVADLRNTPASAIYTIISSSLVSDYTDNTGTVTEISVAPLSSATTIDGLYLSVTNPTGANTAIGLAGSPSVDGTHWTGSGVDEFLVIDHGGTYAGTPSDAAANIFTQTQEGSLIIGEVGNTIIISGSLIIQNPPTTLDTDDLIVEDRFIQLGASDDTDVDLDFGITFGTDSEASNTIVYDGTGSNGRFGLAHSNDSTTNGFTTTNHSLIGVIAGTSDGASVNVNLPGNIKVDNGEIYLFVA